MKLFIETTINLFIDMSFYLMLGFLLVGVMNLFIKRDWIVRNLGENSFLSSVKACLIGVPLPLCSCAVVPTGIYLKDKGASVGTTTAFLISTPQTGVDSIIATYGLMGITFAWFRPVAAFLSGVIGGTIVGALSKKTKVLENNTESVEVHDHDHSHEHSCNSSSCATEVKATPTTFMGKVKSTLYYAYIETVSEVSIHFLVGLLIAVLITIFLPAELISDLGINSGILGMLLMIAIGLPMYICSTASIPIALTLLAKGLSPGVVFVFLFMGPFTNAASLSILSKKLGKKVVALYVIVAALCAILFGYILDYLVNTFDLPFNKVVSGMEEGGAFNLFEKGLAIIFLGLIIYSLVMKFKNHRKLKSVATIKNDQVNLYKVEGMTCGHCSNTVKLALLKIDGVNNVEVSHEDGSVKIYGEIQIEVLRNLISKEGYRLIE